MVQLTDTKHHTASLQQQSFIYKSPKDLSVWFCFKCL